MTRIIAWPPVGTVAADIGVEQRVQRSVSLFSGERFVSSIGPTRRVATLTTSALARGRSGAGYAHMLARLLDGGMNLVRVPLPPVGWHLDALAGSWRRTAPVQGTWDGRVWFDDPAAQGIAATEGGWPVLRVTGFPPGTVARPGEVVRVWQASPLASSFARVVAEARAGATGLMVIRLDAALPSGVVSLGDTEDGVFEVLNIPRAAQPLGADWVFTWPLREVLPYQLPPNAVEVNPWA